MPIATSCLSAGRQTASKLSSLIPRLSWRRNSWAHALSLCPRVAMLLRLSFLESTRRNAILDDGQLARVHVFRNRLPNMHRDGWTASPKLIASLGIEMRHDRSPPGRSHCIRAAPLGSAA